MKRLCLTGDCVSVSPWGVFVQSCRLIATQAFIRFIRVLEFLFLDTMAFVYCSLVAPLAGYLSDNSID